MTIELELLTNPARTKIRINGVVYPGIHTISAYLPECGGEVAWNAETKTYTIKDIPDGNVRIDNGFLTFLVPGEEDDLK